MTTTNTQPDAYDGGDLAPDYGKREFGIADVYVTETGVSILTMTKSTSRPNAAALLLNQMQAAVEYMQEQEALYQREIDAKIAAEIRAERDANRRRR